ncbi:MAG: hypothetical protein EOM20_13880 [Spartobacteria bacterium]|nr:hypothetical protein [Spartobacteria bacterium]
MKTYKTKGVDGTYPVAEVVAALRRLAGDWNYAVNTMTSAGCDLNGYIAGLSKAEHDISQLIDRIEHNRLDEDNDVFSR